MVPGIPALTVGILNVFDVYNAPAVIYQWGFVASIFLKGLVSVTRNLVDVVYNQNDLRSLPNFHSMPMTFLPYLAKMRNVFLDGGDAYQGNADVAVNAVFLNDVDLSEAKHRVYYACPLIGMSCGAIRKKSAWQGRQPGGYCWRISGLLTAGWFRIQRRLFLPWITPNTGYIRYVRHISMDKRIKEQTFATGYQYDLGMTGSRWHCFLWTGRPGKGKGICSDGDGNQRDG